MHVYVSRCTENSLFIISVKRLFLLTIVVPNHNLFVGGHKIEVSKWPEHHPRNPIDCLKRIPNFR
jgi:hypothetical protein